jgi:hypothetical protein
VESIRIVFATSCELRWLSFQCARLRSMVLLYAGLFIRGSGAVLEVFCPLL